MTGAPRLDLDLHLVDGRYTIAELETADAGYVEPGEDTSPGVRQAGPACWHVSPLTGGSSMIHLSIQPVDSVPNVVVSEARREHLARLELTCAHTVAVHAAPPNDVVPLTPTGGHYSFLLYMRAATPGEVEAGLPAELHRLMVWRQEPAIGRIAPLAWWLPWLQFGTTPALVPPSLGPRASGPRSGTTREDG